MELIKQLTGQYRAQTIAMNKAIEKRINGTIRKRIPQPPNYVKDVVLPILEALKGQLPDYVVSIPRAEEYEIENGIYSIVIGGECIGGLSYPIYGKSDLYFIPASNRRSQFAARIRSLDQLTNIIRTAIEKPEAQLADSTSARKTYTVSLTVRGEVSAANRDELEALLAQASILGLKLNIKPDGAKRAKNIINQTELDGIRISRKRSKKPKEDETSNDRERLLDGDGATPDSDTAHSADSCDMGGEKLPHAKARPAGQQRQCKPRGRNALNGAGLNP